MLCWWKWCEVLIKFGEKIIFLRCSAVPDHDRKLECEIFFCNYDADVVHKHRQLIALQAREIHIFLLPAMINAVIVTDKNWFIIFLTMILPEYQTSDSPSSSKFHHLALLTLLVALVSRSSNFHHWPLLALLVVLVLHLGDSADLEFSIL